MKILLIAAHPDDEVLGMGGTIAREVKAGNKVQVLFLATGMLARKPKAPKKALSTLRADARRAAKILGTLPPYFENFPDNQMDSVPLLRVVKIVERYLAKIKPDVVYIHNEAELNIDHRITYWAVMTATRPFKNLVKAVYSFSVPEANMYNYPFQFAPNHFVDISQSLKIKLAAMTVYKSEARLPPHVRSIQGIKTIAAYYGFMAGCKYAEPFKLIRQTR